MNEKKRCEDIIVHVFNKSGMFHHGTYKSCKIEHTRNVVPHFSVGSFFVDRFEVEQRSEILTITCSDKVENNKCKEDHNKIKKEYQHYEHCPYCGYHL